MKTIIICFLFVTLSAASLYSASLSAEDLNRIAKQAIGEDPAIAEAAIADLRAAGQRGVDALRLIVESGRQSPDGDASSLERYHAAVDRVARQKDADRSGLFWHTDFEKAKTEAERLGRPILTLRLLGNLDEELSCANSRFFREIFYSNPDIAARLKNDFVLHWKSVRPVPKVTIDFGDGRVLRRTITGNSIHYVLDQHGRLVDGLPGLYAPMDFLAWLDETREFVRAHSLKAERQWVKAVTTYQRESFETVAIEFDNAIKSIGQQHFIPPSASRWSPAPIRMEHVTAEGWRKLALRHPSLSTPNKGSLWAVSDVVLRDALDPVQFRALRANEFSETKAPTEVPILTMLALDDRNLRRKSKNLKISLAKDSVRNEFVFHRRVHDYLRNRYRTDADALNRWVYSELFEMPDSDPWLGLRTTDFYTGISNDGVVAAPAAN